MLNLVICYTHWTLGVMLHLGKRGTVVTSINGGFFGIVVSTEISNNTVPCSPSKASAVLQWRLHAARCLNCTSNYDAK